MDYPAGHTLLLEDRKQSHLYVLRKGSVEISKGGQRVGPADTLELGETRLNIHE